MLFICYSTRDGLIDERSLRELLDSLPVSTRAFVDMFHNDWPDVQKRIELEIANCDLFLGLRSPAFSASPWVQFELETARKYQKDLILLDFPRGAMPVNGSLFSRYHAKQIGASV